MTSTARRAAVILLVAFSTVSIAGVPAAGADPSTHWVYFQWNMAGRKDYNVGGTLNSQTINALYSYYYSEGVPPQALTVQELCHTSSSSTSQLTAIRNYLAPYGYDGYFYSAIVPSGCSGGFGNATFGFASATPDPARQFAAPYTAQEASPSEYRGIVCNVFPIWTTTHSVCSTHLINDNDTVAIDQLHEATDAANNTAFFHPGLGHFLGGDFNLCYREVVTAAVNPYTSYHIEANGQPTPPAGGCSAVGGQPLYTFNARASWTEKIDYLFAHAQFFSAGFPFRYQYAARSDHALMTGIFTIR